MEKVSVGTILARSWKILLKGWWVWIGIVSIFMFMPFFAFNSWASTQEIGGNGIPLWIFPILYLAIYLHFVVLKLALILVREPDLVTSNIFQAIWYAFSDGFVRRALYAGIAFVTFMLLGVVAYGFALVFLRVFERPLSVGVAILLFTLYFMYSTKGGIDYDMLNNTFSFLYLFYIPLIFVTILFINFCSAPFFLTYYILQDNLSDDNQGYQLSFLDCVKKSLELTKGYRMAYALISTIMTMINQVLVLSLVFSFSNQVDDYLITTATFFIFNFVPFIINSVWANALIENDTEVYFEGD